LFLPGLGSLWIDFFSFGGSQMRKLIFGIFAGIALSGHAFAADLAVKAPIISPPVLDPWVGFYVGANIGGSWGSWRADSSQRVYNFESFAAAPKVVGVIGGVQAGYNWRMAPQWIWGFEADIQATGEKARQTWLDPGLPNTGGPIFAADFVPRPGGPATLSHEWKFPWFGTVRLRAGYNPTPDWLLYLTGGFAFGESKYNFSFSQPGAANNFPPSPTAYALSHSETSVGYAVGAGGEFKINQNWSVKGEYLFIDLGRHIINTRDIDGFPFGVSYAVRDHIARIGINYKFGDGAIVARY
jgi:outer membrane immunogenic protein